MHSNLPHPSHPSHLLILLPNLGQSLIAFIFAYSITHVKNPRWPPHARVHNGQTTSLGLLLSLFSTYLRFRPKQSSTSAREDTFHAALVSSLYFVAGLSAILYPGTDWNDPEFEKGKQMYLFPAFVASAWLGWGWEMWRLGGWKEQGSKEGGKVL